MASPVSDSERGPTTPTGTLSSNGKRKASQSLNGGEKKKRSRVSFSCSECHRRKQKCDRQQPCGHCISRKVPELCHAYQPGKGDGDLHLRLSRVERILELALPHLAGNGGSPAAGSEMGPPLPPSAQGHHRELSPESSQEDELREEEIPNAVGTLQNHTSGGFYGTEALGSVNSTPILEQVRAASGGHSQATLNVYRQFHVPQLPTVDEVQSAADKLSHLIQDCGLQPHKLDELVRGLPPKDLCDDLVDYFFEHINYTRYPIFEPHFRASYEALLAKEHRVHPIDLRIIPLLYVVLAISARMGPDRLIVDSGQRKVTGMRYYWSSRNALMIAAAIGESLELVLARLLISRYLTIDRRITESWNILGTAVRTALALGLHRDGAKLGLDPFQIEYRRRIWAYIYHADHSHALVLGRPPSIQEEYCDALPPRNMDDRLLMGPNVKIPPNLPLTQPTPMTVVILRQSLGRIIGHIVRHFQQVRPTHYSEVITLDEELMEFLDKLPIHFAIDPDTSLDVTHPFIPIHRFLIISEVFFVRISLHRPYMLRKLDSDRFAYSRKACFESAMKDWEVRQAFKKNASADTIRALGGGYREFQSAMISGISLVIDPHGPDALFMHKILDTFLSDHLSIRDPDETTRRELKIIELLKTKSLSVAAGEPIQSPEMRAMRMADDIDPEDMDEGEGNSSRISALRTITVPVPRPRGNSASTSNPSTPLNGHTMYRSSMNGRPPSGGRVSGPFTTPSPEIGLRPLGRGPGSSVSSPIFPSHPLHMSHSHPGGSRLSKSVITHNGNILDDEPVGSGMSQSTGSPTDGSSSAQRMLDNWVNNAQVDSVGGGSFGLSGYDPSLNMLNTSVGGGANWLGLDGGLGSGFNIGVGGVVSDGGVGGGYHHSGLPRTDSSDFIKAASNGVTGTSDPSVVDWNYWESLIDQIRASGGSA